MPEPRRYSESPLPVILWPHLLSDKELAPDPTGSKRRWIQVAKTGDFFSHKYGNFSITSDDLQQMLTNYTTVTPIHPTQLPVDYDHLSMDPKKPGDGKAAAWFVPNSMELRDGGQSLWAEVEWTDDGLDAVQKKHYRFISPSFIKDYVWKNGKNIGTTLVAAAITNHPFLEGMAAITMSCDMGDLAAAPVRKDVAVNLAEVGQKVSLKPGIVPGAPAPVAAPPPQHAAPAAPPAAPQAPPAPDAQASAQYDVVEVVGQGDDQFVKLKDANGAVSWQRVTDLVPAPAGDNPAQPGQQQTGAAPPSPQQHKPPFPQNHMRSSDMDVFKLTDAKGNQVDVKAEDVQTFLAAQLVAAKQPAADQIVISASKFAEFEAAAQTAKSLSDRVEAAENAAKAAAISAHVTMLTSDLDSLSKAARITKPQREYALKQFGTPDQKVAYDEWKAANVSASALVNLSETGSGGDADVTTGTKPDAELAALARARQTEKGIPYATAVQEIANERQDLSTSYHQQVNPKAGGARIIH